MWGEKNISFTDEYKYQSLKCIRSNNARSIHNTA